MTIKEVTAALVTAFGSSKVFYDHVFIEGDTELPPAYIVTNTDTIATFYADNVPYFSTTVNTATLYTEKYDLDAMAQLESVLRSLDIPFENDPPEFDTDSYMYATVYRLSLDTPGPDPE